jgi:hypothetical protein
VDENAEVRKWSLVSERAAANVTTSMSFASARYLLIFPYIQTGRWLPTPKSVADGTCRGATDSTDFKKLFYLEVTRSVECPTRTRGISVKIFCADRVSRTMGDREYFPIVTAEFTFDDVKLSHKTPSGTQSCQNQVPV